MPFFSIVIPVFNRSSFITDTVNSVLLQEYKEFELLVIDDGSTDSTNAILHHQFASDGRIKIITQENKERGAARNNGFKHATGTYIVFLDSDDRQGRAR